MLYSVSIKHIISTDILSIILSIVMIHLANRNINIDKKKSKLYIFTVLLLILELTMQIIGKVLMGRVGTAFVVFNHIQRFASCFIAPCIIVGMYSIHNTVKKQSRKWIALPLIINAFLLLLNLKRGFIYTIGTYNIVIRQEYYMIEGLICVGYFMLLMISTLKNIKHKTKSDTFLLHAIFIVPIVGAALWLFTGADVIWISMTISLNLYYVFLRDEDLKKDILTGVYTRAVLKDDIKDISCDNWHESIHVGVFDLNNFKDINDTYGHQVGDYILSNAAGILYQAFGHFTKLYRTGGDEFCMLAYNANESEINRSICELDRLIADWNNKSEYKISVARGFSKCTTEDFGNFMEYYTKADFCMYENKKQCKLEAEKAGKQHE